MSNSERYRFINADSALGEAAFRPYLPISLNYQNSIERNYILRLVLKKQVYK